MRLPSPAPPAEATPAASGRARPVMLVTTECGFDPEAERVAVASALEASAQLCLVDLMDVALQPCTAIFGSRCSLATPDERAAVRRTADTAAALGLTVQLLHVRSPRPARALRELVAELRPGLLVFGPSRPPQGRRGRQLVETVRDERTCLVFIAGDAG